VSIKSIHKQNILEGLAAEELGTIFLGNRLSHMMHKSLGNEADCATIGIGTELMLIYIDQSPYTTKSIEEIKCNNKQKRK